MVAANANVLKTNIGRIVLSRPENACYRDETSPSTVTAGAISTTSGRDWVVVSSSKSDLGTYVDSDVSLSMVASKRSCSTLKSTSKYCCLHKAWSAPMVLLYERFSPGAGASGMDSCARNTVNV